MVKTDAYILIILSNRRFSLYTYRPNIHRDMKRRTLLTAFATPAIGATVIGTARAKQNPRKKREQVTEVVKDDRVGILIPADCLGGASGGSRQYLDGWLRARLTLQHDGDLQTDEAVRVRGSIGGEVEQRYGNGVWRAKVNFPSPYAYVQAFEPRFLYIPEAEVVARPIRGGRDRPILKSTAAVEIEGGDINVSGRRPVQCV